MENASIGTYTLIRYNFLIRETLEYCLKKNEYKVEAFKLRKQGILFEIENPTLLKQYLDKGGENGEKVIQNIKDFYAEIYGDESTIVRNAEDGLRVDHAQHLKIYEMVLPIHEQIQRFIDSRIKYAREHNILEQNIEDLWKADERFYRGLVFLTAMNDLEALFIDFGKAMAENKGQPSPQSNFIQNDINKLTSLINFSKTNANIPETDYHVVADQVTAVIEMMYHKRELPQGKQFKEVFQELRNGIRGYIAATEQAWIKLFVPTEQDFESKMKEVQEEAAKKKDENLANNNNAKA